MAWFGALTTNAFIIMPAIRRSLEPTEAGILMGAIMKRFKVFIYINIGVLILTGIGITGVGENSAGYMQFDNLWHTILSIKHILTIIMVVSVIYGFEGLGRKVSRLAAKGPSPELARLQKRQISFSYIGLVMAIIILILTAILTAI